jgi:hypothetical protein
MFLKERPGTFDFYFRTQRSFLIQEVKKARIPECGSYDLTNLPNKRLSRSRKITGNLTSVMKTLKVKQSTSYQLPITNYQLPIT